MLAGLALLAVLDATIVSATPNLTRLVLAGVVTVVVVGFIAAVWRSNSRLEKAAIGSPKDGRSSGKPVAGRSR